MHPNILKMFLKKCLFIETRHISNDMLRGGAAVAGGGVCVRSVDRQRREERCGNPIQQAYQDKIEADRFQKEPHTQGV